jgi:hypothetical protein
MLNPVIVCDRIDAERNSSAAPMLRPSGSETSSFYIGCLLPESALARQSLSILSKLRGAVVRSSSISQSLLGVYARDSRPFLLLPGFHAPAPVSKFQINKDGTFQHSDHCLLRTEWKPGNRLCCGPPIARNSPQASKAFVTTTRKISD